MRGEAKFVPGDMIKTEVDRKVPDYAGQHSEPDINGRAPKLPGDPMRNILSDKGLVDSNISKKGFGRNLTDEASASIKHNGEETMARGHAEFVPMTKGFGVELKGDVAAEEQLSNKADSKKPPKKALQVNEDDLTISPELQLVEDASKRDIEDGYVSDCQGERVGKKGFEAYNEMVTKGVAADIEVNQHNITEAMGQIAEHTGGMIVKSLDEGIVIKGGIGKLATRAGLGLAAATGNAGKVLEKVGRKAEGAVQGAGNKLTSIGSKTENALNRANKATTRTGVTEGRGALGRAADVAGKNRKATGAAVLGAGAAGVGGAAYGAKKLTEEKCAPGKTMKMKGAQDDEASGLETKGIREAASKVVGMARKAGKKVAETAKDPEARKAVGAAAGGAAIGAGLGLGSNAAIGAGAGALGAGPGKRLEGAKLGAKTELHRTVHPIQALKRDWGKGGRGARSLVVPESYDEAKKLRES